MWFLLTLNGFSFCAWWWHQNNCQNRQFFRPLHQIEVVTKERLRVRAWYENSGCFVYRKLDHSRNMVFCESWYDHSAQYHLKRCVNRKCCTWAGASSSSLRAIIHLVEYIRWCWKFKKLIPHHFFCFVSVDRLWAEGVSRAGLYQVRMRQGKGDLAYLFIWQG